MESWPIDARGVDTTYTSIPFDDADLDRFAEIAEEDLTALRKDKKRKLAELHLCSVLADDAADHWISPSRVKCISIWHFFRKQEETSPFHPIRKRRIDFGSDKFGHSSWVKHPGDQGFVGRGINLFGRSIKAEDGEELSTTMARYLKEDKSAGAKRLKGHAMVILKPEGRKGEVVWEPPR